MRSPLRNYWPRLLGCALLLLFTGSIGRFHAHARAHAKQASHAVTLQQRAAALPQTHHNLTFRSAVFLPAGATVLSDAAVVRCALCSAAAHHHFYASTDWRPAAPRPPPFPA